MRREGGGRKKINQGGSSGDWAVRCWVRPGLVWVLGAGAGAGGGLRGGSVKSKRGGRTSIGFSVSIDRDGRADNVFGDPRSFGEDERRKIQKKLGFHPTITTRGTAMGLPDTDRSVGSFANEKCKSRDDIWLFSSTLPY